MLRRILPLGLLAAAAGAAPPLVLSDTSTLAGWSRGGSLIDDAKVGRHAVRFDLAPGRVGGPVLDFRASGVEPLKSHRLTFWYRFGGTGRSSLMIKLVCPLTEGWQGTWLVAPEVEADGQWRQGVVDLGSPWMKWGEQPDLEARQICFRTEATAGSKMTLDIDQVQLETIVLSARVVRAALTENGLAADLELSNHTGMAQTVTVLGQRLTLPPDGQARPSVTVPVPPAQLAALPALTALTREIELTIAGPPDQTVRVEASAARPLTLPARPRLMLSDGEIPAVKARAAGNPLLAARLAALLRAADQGLLKKVELPDHGGQWPHWYACKKDGANLVTLSPTQHKCPVCGTIYTGWPYDDVVILGIHDGWARLVQTLGLAARLTGEARYADKCREILLAYANRYPTYPLHDINGQPRVGGGKVGPQTLDESMWVIPVLQGADLIWDKLSDSDRQTIETNLLRPCAEVIRNHKMGIHNIQCWKNSAVGLTGLLLGDAELVADAVTSEHGFKAQMARGVDLDGQWFEGAWGYHFFTMQAVSSLAEAGERCGLGLYAYDDGGHGLRKLFDGPLALAMPNRVLPNFSDSDFVDVTRQADLYELAFTRYGDPRYAELIAGTKADSLNALLVGTRPLPAVQRGAAESHNYTEAGYAVLQVGGGPEATWAAFKYGPHGGGHGHPDKLSFILYARGKVIGVDPGTGKYGVPIHAGWQRTSIAHNTLTVDETDQQPTTGHCLAFESHPGWAAAMADAGGIYNGLDYRRAVALAGANLVLVLDLVKADHPHNFDLAWHNAGAWLAPPTGEAVPMPDKNGYRYLQDVVKTTGALPPLGLAPLTIGVAVTSAQPGETWAGTGAGNTSAERVPCVVRRIKGREAVVAWAIALDGTVPSVTLSQDGANWRVQAGGRTLTVGAASVAVE
jgi:hypothetical protein